MGMKTKAKAKICAAQNEGGESDQDKAKRLAMEIDERLGKATEFHWEAGDLLTELLSIPLHGGKPLTLKSARAAYFPHRNYSVLSMAHRTAKAFDTTERAVAFEAGATFRDCYEAQAARNSLVKRHIVAPDAPLSGFIADIMANKQGEKVNSKAITRKRTNEKANELRAEKRAEAEAYFQDDKHGEWVKRFLRMDCLDFLRESVEGKADRIAPGSLIGAWLDPPYIFRQNKGGRNNPFDSVGGCRTEGVIVDADATTALTLASIDLASQLLNPERGWLVLWATGAEPDEPAIVELLRERFGYILPLFWRKVPQAGAQYPAFAVSGEKLLLCAKNREAFTKHFAPPELGRSQELQLNLENFRSPTRSFAQDVAAGRKRVGDVSLYEKPLDLCRYMLEKLTLPGDLIYDAFGCSASMVEACILERRAWFYTELHETNYAYGLARIRQLMDGQDPALAEAA